MNICLNISAFAILENGAFAFSILIISASDAPFCNLANFSIPLLSSYCLTSVLHLSQVVHVTLVPGHRHYRVR